MIFEKFLSMGALMFGSSHEREVWGLPDEEKARRIFDLEDRLVSLQHQLTSLKARKKDNESAFRVMFIAIWLVVFSVSFGLHSMNQYIQQVGWFLLVVWTFACSASLVWIANERVKLGIHFGWGVVFSTVLTAAMLFLIKLIVEM